jgi:hypothetical protein
MRRTLRTCERFAPDTLAALNATFIFGHEKIEVLLQLAVGSVHSALTNCIDGHGQDEMTDKALGAALAAHREVTRHMREHYGTLDREAFNIFRQYLHPTRNHQKGPSGAYSANHSALRTLALGLLESRRDFRQESSLYYPVQDRAQLAAAEQFVRAHNLCLGNALVTGMLSNTGRTRGIELLDELITEAKAHLGAVLRALKPTEGKEPGTGGQSDARAFLESGIREMEKVRNNAIQGADIK